MEFGKAASITNVLDQMKQLDISIDSIEMVKPTYTSDAVAAAIITLRLKHKRVRIDVISQINGIQGVDFVEEI